MNRITRRSLLASGVTAAVAAFGGAVTAAGRRFGLVPPDAEGVFAPGNTLATLRGMEVRSQITSVTCEEGWS